MKRIAILLVLLPLFAAAQTQVDRVTRAIDSLTTFSFDDWKMSPDLKLGKPLGGDPTTEGFNDADWATLRINQWVYPDSVWLRKEIVLPETMLGAPVEGKVTFLVTVDDYGYLWINGESKGRFLWDGEFTLTENAKPGQRFLIAIKAINTGGPLRLLRSEIETERIQKLRASIQDFSLSLRVGQRLLSNDTYMENPYSGEKVNLGIDRSEISKSERSTLNDQLQNLAAKVDVDALAQGKIETFRSSLESVRSGLKPIDDFAKRFTLVFASNAHIDAAWLWRKGETKIVAKNTFTSVLNMMDNRPDFTYTQSAAVYYKWMQDLYPDVFQRIRKRVADGRWEVVGGMWVEPDCNLPDGSSWTRHLLYSKRYFQKELGADVTLGWNPDSFGYNWNIPQFYLDAGIDAFITQKIGWNDTDVFPYRVFWWEGPNGAKILTYFPFDYVNNVADPYGLADWMRQFDANTGFTKMMVLFGVGDHGGGPTNEMLARIDHLKTLDIYPKVEFSTSGKYVDWLKQQDPKKIPVWNDELYLEYHRGTMTTQSEMKENNRKSEVLLTNAEKFSSLATLAGRKYDSGTLEKAWDKVLFNQFHDLLPGSGIREIYIDALEDYAKAQEAGKYELRTSLDALAGQVNTSAVKKGRPLVVSNPLSWPRTDLATFDLAEGDTNSYAVYDGSGRELSSQMITVDQFHRRVKFLADNVPSLGYKVFDLRKKEAGVAPGMLDVTPNRLENDFFRITIDPDSGWVQSIYDKKNNREVLAGYGDRLQLLEDKPKQWDAWNLGWTGVMYPTTLRSVTVDKKGPLEASIRIRRDMLGPSFQRDYPAEGYPSSFFTQEIILYKGIDRIDFKTDVDWWEDHTMLKVAFPVTVNDTVATYEIPYGTIERSTQSITSWQKAKKEVPAIRWADLSADGYGVSLINNTKYGYDIKGNVMRLSLLRSPKWPDPTADRGKHTIAYSLYPHAGDWKTAGTVRRGYEFNVPLLVRETGVHKGKLPPERSFISVDAPDVVLATLKKAEDSNAWIAQLYETEGRDADAHITLPAAPKRVMISDFLEHDGASVTPSKNVVPVHLKRNSILMLKIEF